MVINCNLCNKEFKYPYLLQKHLQRKIKCDIKGYNCNKCGKIFTRNYDLKKHEKRKTSCIKIELFKNSPQNSTIHSCKPISKVVLFILVFKLKLFKNSCYILLLLLFPNLTSYIKFHI